MMLIKLIIDFIMTVCFLLLMAYRITENTVHELLGVSIFLLFIIHNIMNRQFYLMIFKGKYNGIRVLRTTIDLLFVLNMVVMLVSSLFISHNVFNFMYLNGSLFVRKIHVFCACWGFLLMSIHLGMHLSMIMSILRKMTGLVITNRIFKFVIHAAALPIIVYGAKAFIDKNIGSKLMMYYAYDTWNIDESAIGILLSYLSIMGMFVCMTYYALKLKLRCNKLYK